MFRHRSVRFFAVAAVAAVVLAAVPQPADAQSDDDFVPVTDAMLQDPDPADWPSGAAPSTGGATARWIR